MKRRERRLALLALFVLLAVAHTWPLASAPGTLTRHDNADTYLNQWTLAWVAHALPRQPLHLFDANIFYPARHALAFSEHLIVQGIMGAPLSWGGASPVLVFNVVLLAGFALTGWATALVVRRWTGDWLAGLLAGSVAAFNTHTLSRLGHVQAVHVEFLPLALFALDRLLAQPRVRHAVALAGWSALQMLCSGYLLVFTVVTLTVGALSRAGEWLTPGRVRRALPMLALAGIIATSCCLPFLVPYAEVREEQHLVRPLDEVALYSASPSDYLTTVANLHYAWWSHRFYRGTDALFPGVIPLTLALLSVITGVAWRDARARMLLASGLVCLLLSFGPATRLYVWLYHVVPLLEGIRGAARFGYITIFAVGVLAGFGLAWCRTRCATTPFRQRAVLAAAILAVALVNVEALTAPHDEFTRFDGIPRVYRCPGLRAPGRRRRDAVLAGCRRVEERCLRVQLDAPLAPARERLQRLHAAGLRPGRDEARVVSGRNEPRMAPPTRRHPHRRAPRPRAGTGGPDR